MDRSEVRAIVDREIEGLLKVLGIGHWRVNVTFRPAGPDEDGSITHGECSRLVDYDSAHITFNPESFETEDEVLRTLRHELFHIVLSPFDLYTGAVDRLKLDDAMQRVVDGIWHHACEQAVINLERMHKGLTANG